VLQSETLRGSEGLRQMLQFLGERALRGEAGELKEYTVGVEACGKPESYDPQKDASVRVQAGRLRKRLGEYYAGEGAAERVVVDVPKGRFEVVFRRRDTEQGGARQWNWKMWAVGAAAVACLSWAMILQRQVREWEGRYGLQERDEMEGRVAETWRPFLDRRAPTLAVIGSPAFYVSGDEKFWVRLPEREDEGSSRAELEKLRAKLGLLNGPRYEYASMADALAVQKLTAFLARAGVSVRTVGAHQATWEAASEGNLILLGEWQTNPLLRGLPVSRDFDLRQAGLAQNRNPQPGEPLAYTLGADEGTGAFVVAATYAGLKPGREILAIQAQNAAGAAGALESLMDRESAAGLLGRAGAHGRHYQMLLKVWLDRGAAVKTEFVTCH
jgi:hypothetical protein